MITGIHHVALVVADLDAAERYYCAAAGLRRLSEDAAQSLAALIAAPAGPPPASALLAGPNGYLLLLAPQRPLGSPGADDNPINRPGIRHFCVQNHDCAILERAVVGNHGSLIAAPLDLGTGNQYAYARDGEGNIMEIEGLPYARPDLPTWIGHIAIVTEDMDAATGFYSGLFGAELSNRSHVGPGPQFDRMGGLVGARLEGAWLPVGNMQIELWQFHAPSYQGDGAARAQLDLGYSHITLETTVLEATAERLVELGGQLISGVAESELARSTFATDPEGNVLQLLELGTGSGLPAIAALANPAICAMVEAGRAIDKGIG
jgi:catechol 2,3-dioxygenase-like lactoylglutathione lyase family enzyme